MLLPIEDVITAYLEECIRWDVIYQNAKYTLMEMLNNRRHQRRYCPSKLQLGPGRTMQDVGRAKSVRELAELFGLDAADFNGEAGPRIELAFAAATTAGDSQ